MAVMEQEKDLEPATPAPVTLQEWRERILESFLRFACWISLIVVVIDSSLIMTRREFDEAIWTVATEAIGILVLFCMVWLRQIPYTIRAGVIPFFLFVLGCIDIVLGGINTEGRFLFLICVLFVIVFFNERSGWLLFALTIGIMVLRLVLWGAGPQDPTLHTAINDVVIFAYVVMIVIVPATHLIRGLASSTDESATLAREAQTARVLAEERNAELSHSNTALAAAEQRLLDLVATLETPTVALAEGVLLAPIIGTLDERRMQRLTERILTDVHTQQAYLVIIDVTGVASVDTQIAQQLIQLVQALQLLGCRPILTGISAANAATITNLGMTLEGIRMMHSPREVLQNLHRLA